MPNVVRNFRLPKKAIDFCAAESDILKSISQKIYWSKNPFVRGARESEIADDHYDIFVDECHLSTRHKCVLRGLTILLSVDVNLHLIPRSRNIWKFK